MMMLFRRGLRRCYHSSSKITIANSNNLSPLMCISPIDGRYSGLTSELQTICSEYGLIRNRVHVEIQWLQTLADNVIARDSKLLSNEARNTLNAIVENFSLKDGERIKEIENTTRHDVKAVEYFVKEKVMKHNELKELAEYFHFACTSEDVNNVSYALQLKQCRNEILLPLIDNLIEKMREMAHLYANEAMLCRTHGQPATPSTMGKEIANFIYRLKHARESIKTSPIRAKFNGAVGNYNAHMISYPEIDWMNISNTFITSFGLQWNQYTTQIENHDFIAQLFHHIIQFNTILLDFNRDMWSYISLGYYKQKVVSGEIGSSTMPHKVNPIDFENAEGNLGLANAILDHMALKLPISRFQRDLSDSTVLRSVGVGLAHTVIAIKSTLKGLNRVELNAQRLSNELDMSWEVLAEPIQTVMRRYDIENPYEKLKDLTRGQGITNEKLQAFIHTLDIPDNEKQRLLNLTPHTYIGNAMEQAKRI